MISEIHTMPASSSLASHDDGNYNEAHLRSAADTADAPRGRPIRRSCRPSAGNLIETYFRSNTFRHGTTEEATRVLDLTELLPIIVPFCPRRAMEALSAGFYHDPLTGSINVSPTPRKKSVALLLVRPRS